MITDEYRAGWRAACAHLHDLFEEAAGFYGDAPGRAAITGTYRRAAAVALGEAEDPQAGLVVAGGVVEPSPLTAEEATPDCMMPPSWAAKPGGKYDTRLPEELLVHLHNRDARYMPADPPAPLFTGDEAKPHPPRRRHDPSLLMEEPDLYPKVPGPDNERRADDAHMAAGEAWMEHDAEQGERGAR